jgi:hypothetical protein
MESGHAVIRCEDCAGYTPLKQSRMADVGLVCEECATVRAATPPIVTPVWTRLRRAIGISRKN